MDASLSPPPVPTTDLSVPWPQVERFVGLFTHDVRNGLNAVELQLTLLGEISDDPEVKAEVKRVRASVAEVTRQLHSVRIATGKPAPHVFLYPASDFVEDLRERFERQHPGDATRIQWRIEPGARSLSIDPELAMAALLELLANSLFFAAAGSPVAVHIEERPDGLTFSIRQNSGTASANSPDTWGRTPLTSSRRDGYGLGAFRAMRLIEAQKGTLHFAHSEADQSLVTTVVLPLATTGDTAG